MNTPSNRAENKRGWKKINEEEKGQTAAPGSDLPLLFRAQLVQSKGRLRSDSGV